MIHERPLVPRRSNLRFVAVGPLCAVAALVLFSGLAAEEKPAPAPAEKKKAAPVAFEVGGLKFKSPKGWEQKPVRSRMRKAQFALKGAPGTDPAEVVFYFFGPGQGGSTSANVDRWLGQFVGGKGAVQSSTAALSVGGHKVTVVRAKGTYLSGPPIGRKVPKANYALLGAIIEGDVAPIFIKMTGPAATVQGADAAFLEMIKSPFAGG